MFRVPSISGLFKRRHACDRGRICRKHLLDCRILFDHLVDRGGGFNTKHTLENKPSGLVFELGPCRTASSPRRAADNRAR